MAQSLRERAGGALVALHVHLSQPFPLRGLHPDVDALAREEAHALLHRQLAAVGVPARATGHVAVSTARDELARLSPGLDLLVVGSHGYGPVRRTLLRSTSDRIVHTAACPVVVVPRGAARRDAHQHAATHALAGHANR